MNRPVITIDTRAIDTDSASDSAAYCTIETARGPNPFAFGFTGPDAESRREHGGPKLPGPYLYAFGLSVGIHNGPIQARPPALFLNSGDVVRVRHLVRRGFLMTFDFVAEVCPRGYVKFELVAATADGIRRRDVSLKIEAGALVRTESGKYAKA